MKNHMNGFSFLKSFDFDPPIVTQLKHRRFFRKRSLTLFERSEFSNSRKNRGAQGVRRTKWRGCPFFWFVCFGQAKKMNNNRNLSLKFKRTSSSIVRLSMLYCQLPKTTASKYNNLLTKNEILGNHIALSIYIEYLMYSILETPHAHRL